MGGGLMQLVAYGAQDIYLTGNPQMTYFKSVYNRITNFSIESRISEISRTIRKKNIFNLFSTCSSIVKIFTLKSYNNFVNFVIMPF